MFHYTVGLYMKYYRKISWFVLKKSGIGIDTGILIPLEYLCQYQYHLVWLIYKVQPKIIKLMIDKWIKENNIILVITSISLKLK